MSSTTTLEWTISEEVQAFAQEQGVAAHLPTLLEATQQIFPAARRRAVQVTEDPEIANDRHIVIEVDAPLTVQEGLVARRRWNEAALRCCPTALICVFRLSLELVE